MWIHLTRASSWSLWLGRNSTILSDNDSKHASTKGATSATELDESLEERRTISYETKSHAKCITLIKASKMLSFLEFFLGQSIKPKCARPMCLKNLQVQRMKTDFPYFYPISIRQHVNWFECSFTLQNSKESSNTSTTYLPFFAHSQTWSAFHILKGPCKGGKG